MKTNKTFRELFDSVRQTLPYRVESLVLDFTDQIVNRMQYLHLSRSDFASRLGSSPAYVTKVLSGGTNFTLESMVKVADALDSEIQIQIVPKDSTQVWLDVMAGSEEARPRDYALINEWRRSSRAGEGRWVAGSQDSHSEVEIDQMFLTS
jgi:transcriptional regulator with XRE-family HTH domain